MQKAVFQTDNDGLYLYQSTANELALTPGTFNIPYGAYEDAPPAPPAGKWPRRLGDAWAMVDDYRTTPLYAPTAEHPYLAGRAEDETPSTAAALIASLRIEPVNVKRQKHHPET